MRQSVRRQPVLVNGAAVGIGERKRNIDMFEKIEVEVGRVKTPNKQGPREIDLDIIIWNSTVVDNDVFERQFLRESVLELLPGFEF